MFISFLLLCAYFGTVACGLYFTGAFNLYKNAAKSKLLVFFGIAVAFVVFIISLMAREKFIYFWDYGSFWHSAVRLKANNLWYAVKLLGYSVNTDEYNLLPCAIITLPLNILGGSYIAFVLTNICLFYIPNAFVIAFILKKLAQKMNLKAAFIALFVYALTFTVFLFPILDGYIDIIAMLPLSVSMLLIVDRDFSKVDVKKDLALGMSVLWVAVLRRYFAYAIVGEALFAFCYWLAFGTGKNRLFVDIKTKLLDMAITLIIPVVCLLVFFSGYLIMSVFNNHVVAYSAYKTTNLLGEFAYFLTHFGLLFDILALSGFVFCLLKKHKAFAICLVIELLVTCLMFFRIQDMHAHQYYTVALPMCIFVFLGMANFVNLCRTKRQALAVSFIMLAVCSANFWFSFKANPKKPALLSRFFVQKTFVPRTRNDISELNRLENCLVELDSQGYKGVYCLGSSVIINDDILRKLHAPKYELPYLLYWAGQVDLRDGFRTDFLDADVLIACEPVQCHLPHGQELVHELNKIVTEANEFSDNYEFVKSFALDNGVKALVYARKEKLTKQDVLYIEERVNALHPEHPELFKDKIEDYIASEF